MPDILQIVVEAFCKGVMGYNMHRCGSFKWGDCILPLHSTYHNRVRVRVVANERSRPSEVFSLTD